MDPLLEYACRRVTELETLLLVDVDQAFVPGDICRHICQGSESKKDMW